MTSAIDAFNEPSLRDHILKALEHAKHRGMDASEAVIQVENGFSVTARSADVESVEHHQAKSLQITVYQDDCSGTAATTDLAAEAVIAVVDKACAIARYADKDVYSGLAKASLMATHYPDLQLYHPWDISTKQAIELAITCDATTREQDPRITDAEGSSLNTYGSLKVYANSHDFIGSYRQSLHSLNCCVVARSNDKMQRDHEYTIARSADDLEDSILLAKQAVQKVLRRLDARCLSTRHCPVVFHAPIAKGLLGHLIAAISGRQIYQKSSFLLDQLGQKISPEFIHIYQRPHLIGGMGSIPFDQEGVATRDLDYVKDGILQSYVLSSYSARKLDMQTTGNAGGVFNLNITQSELDLAALLKKMGTGLLVTELMGQGVNIVTGDYSRGAAGFWIENGEIQYAVDEITIAGQLKDMFKNIIAVANDVDHRSSIQTGSILIEEMTVAGE